MKTRKTFIGVNCNYTGHDHDLVDPNSPCIKFVLVKLKHLETIKYEQSITVDFMSQFKV